MPAEPTGLWVLLAAAAGALVREVGRIFRPRTPKPDRVAQERELLAQEWARLDEEKRGLFAEVRDELDECRKRSDELEALVRAERLRVALLIRALQEAGIPVPDAALLEVDFDPATGRYQIRGDIAA